MTLSIGRLGSVVCLAAQVGIGRMGGRLFTQLGAPARNFLTVVNQYQKGVTMTFGKVTAVNGGKAKPGILDIFFKINKILLQKVRSFVFPKKFH